MPQTHSRRVARFEDFEVDFRARELYKLGRGIKLQERALQVLDPESACRLEQGHGHPARAPEFLHSRR
jgi:hypothetical protein